MKENIHQTTQIIGGVVAAENQQRLAALQEALDRQSGALAEALKQIQKVRDFVGTPEHILGNPLTKHGEIAEQVEVGVRNARDLVNQLSPSATDNVPRTAPEDYLVNSVQVQSKFLNGINNTLGAVQEHMNKYEHFGRDGSYYDIPRDQYQVIEKVIKGESVDGLAEKTVRTIREHVQEIEKTTGKSFTEVVKPSVSSYPEVQQGKVHETLDQHDQNIHERNDERKVSITLEHQPSFQEMAQVALKGAAIGAGLSLTFKLIGKYRQGKRPFTSSFTAEDWQDVGLAAAQGGTTGGISGAVIYGLTNFADLSAPLAGAVVSASFAVASLAKSYRRGDIGLDELIDLGQLSCVESAMVAAAAAMGQAVIPIPVLGAVIGTITGRMLIGFGKKYLADQAAKLEKRLDDNYTHWMDQIERTYQAVVSKIMLEFQKLGDLMDAAFDESLNTALRLQASVDLARAHQVEESKIIHTVDELDLFMLS